METNRIKVKSEFAPLKKVVLTQSEFIFPARDENFKDDAFLSKESLSLLDGVDTAAKNYKEVFPERQRKWENERENLKKVLEKYGVEVVRPRLLTDYEKESGREFGSCNFFVRDPFFTVGPSIIEGSLRFFHRRNEVLPIRDILVNEAYSTGAFYVSVPRPDSSEGIDAEQGPFLEGGDVLVLDKTVFVGNSGLASNYNGYLWLQSFLSHFGYEVVEVPLKQDVLHLDCALSLVRDGLMIICEEALINGIPKALKDWDKISVPYKDIAYLAVNGLPVNESTYILDPQFEYIAEQLKTRGITVEYIDFEISRSLGGSFRCSTQPLVRV
ncbi:amidinotransferase [Clostridium sp. WB02_MRS01]|uniref:dimethylarginine dimethylaminohydrolase family protein n=1 Tax=Clostridium sp. WB02_MRS01 TaxID=2605777 RepID=UPI0012B25D27|nr:arginine deiminase family protein [Clostridium sp. WB02_MRS01]MSS11560.1 amidinotransferase [Clostridium sp. WB02_MRS01]